MQYTIKSIDSQGNVHVSFNVDNKDQVIAGLPVEDAAALAQALSDYGTAYEAGLATAAVQVDSSIPLNQPQAVTPASS